MNAILDVRGLSRSFGGLKAVDCLSFRLEKGELLAMIGPNGAGKSTCFDMLTGHLRPTSGEIFLKDEPIGGRSPRDIWRRGVGRTFQVAAIYASMTVSENVQMALIARDRGLFSILRRARRIRRDEAMALLDLVGMADHADRHCATLAYGDLKRLELAGALAHVPDILLMDEPTAGMAPGERRALMRLVSEISRDRGVSVLFTEHDMDAVFGYANRILVLNRGRLAAQGGVEEIRADSRVREIYLGSGTPLASGGADA